MFLKIFILFILFLTSLQAEKTDTEILGDALSLVIPLSAFISTVYINDTKSQKEFYTSYATTLASTFALKFTIDKKRPNAKNNRSFPSGHTSSAFSGASFIHFKYGFKYAIIPYIGAIFTGYSRVETKQHYLEDVIGGAIIGTVASYLFTTKYTNIHLAPLSLNGYKGLKINYKW